MIKKIIALLIFVGCLANIVSCSPYVTWKEEVMLNDGHLIVVEQKRRMEGQIGREAWLTMSLPEISPQPIIWHENLAPLILNIDEGRLFVVANAPTGLEQRKYGTPTPAYYGFEWKNGVFVRIPFKEISKNIYTTNLLLGGSPKKGESFIDIRTKNNYRFESPPYTSDLLKLDPNLGCQSLFPCNAF